MTNRAADRQRARRSWPRPNPVFSDEYAAIRTAVIAARKSAGLSQRELAARIGKVSSHVALIERGQRRIDTLELFRISCALGLAPGDFFSQIAAAIEQEAAPAHLG